MTSKKIRTLMALRREWINMVMGSTKVDLYCPVRF